MSLTYTVNCSLLFKELPLLERPQAVAREGFGAVEYWWPFDIAAPAEAEIDAFVGAIQDAGVQLSGLNFFAGDMPNGERGIVCNPHRTAEFQDNVARVVEIGRRLGCRAFNALYGNFDASLSAERQHETALENLTFAAQAVSVIGGTVLLEPVSGAPAYPIKTADQAADIIGRVRAAGGESIGLLMDLYHLAANGDDLDLAIKEHTALTAHVQIADFPGRHEPGTGSLDLDRLLGDLASGGYDGYVGLEYAPEGETAAGLSWLADERRGRGQAIAGA